MHGNRYIFAFRALWLSVMACFALSCHKELIYPQDNAPVAKPLSEITVEFRISDPDAAPLTKFSAEDGYASDAEKKINTIHLIVADYDPQTGEETVEEVVTVEPAPSDFTSDGVKAGHTFRLPAGIKRFYAGANMTQAHLNAFKNRTSMKAGSYEEALKMVMTNYQSKDGKGTDILMLSAPATEDSGNQTDIDITGKRLIYINAKLERLVSKVMTVAKYTNARNETLGSRAGQQVDYIETDLGYFFDFRFILVNTNKTLTVAKTFEDGDLFNADANWRMKDMVEENSGSVRYKSMWDCTENLSLWDQDGIEERLSSIDDWWCQAVMPSNDAVPAPTRNAYMGKGLYCLENTVYDDLGLSGDLKTAASYLTTTHVYIKARFAPKKLNGWQDGLVKDNKTIYDMSTVTDASGKYPYTFYINKKNGQVYSLEAMNRWITNGTAVASDFDAYLGGWVYFKTFFEGDRTADGKLVHNSSQWGIRRNDYCILTIQNIVNWGSVSPGEAFIKVKSETVPWVKRGSSEITVTPE